MKKNFLVVFSLIVLASCQDTPKADKAETGDKEQVSAASGESYMIDTAATFVEWAGSKPTATHTGILKVSEGKLLVGDNNSITGGSFTIDPASITNKDLSGEDNGKLIGHLKSPDFFDVEKYPTAKFEITKVEIFDANQKSELEGATHLISGNLTLKDSTKNISFPAKVQVSENAVTAEAIFNIDRSQWGLNYKGPNNPQDWVIKKEVNLSLNLKANKL